MTTLRERVEECERRRPGVLRAEIARAAGIKQPSVTDWFNGKTVRLKLKPAVKAAELWGCDPLWLGEGEGLPRWTDATVASHSHALLAPSLERALEILSIELARDVRDDVRDDIADALAKLARRRGQERDQRQVLALLRPSAEKQLSAVA
jgi:transcriptional regulator with XRE-family HTH domain